MPAPQEDRPIYRHIVVARKALVEHVDVEQLRRLRQQLDAGVPIDEDLKHLVVHDTLKASMKKVMGWAGHGDVPIEGTDDGGLNPGAVFDEAIARAERGDEKEGPVRYQRQSGVVVSRIVRDHIPGGLDGEAMPGNAQMLHHPGFESADDPESEFLRAAEELQQKFEAFSDNKFLLLDDAFRAGCTLVTLVLTPITAIPRADVGVELLCEFHQKTRFGHVDTDSFEVFSEIGVFPIERPSDMDMALMFKTVDEVFGTTQGP